MGVTSDKFPIENFRYNYLKGPVDSSNELNSKIESGNCRLALQLYFYRIHNIFLKRDDIYLPGGYKILGRFVFKEEPINFDELKQGDILYAQNLRSKEGRILKRDPKNYKDKDEWLYHLHSAIYLGEISGLGHAKYIWHATSIEDGTTVWTLEKFQHFYKPISAKRLL